MSAAATTVTNLHKTFGSGPDAVHAVRGVSFEAAPGDSIAIIGRNGAGKSTLLQMVAGVLAPSAGEVVRPARVASMLELGSSFHPDLTGWENLELGLALAALTADVGGVSRADLVEFSGLGDAMAKPVKHYSDGMKARLACTVAVHTSPDLLIVDEVLAVGDASFQREVLTRVHDLLARGTTLLLVTHSVELARFTERSIWLDHGETIRDGNTETVLEEYELTSSGGRRYSREPAGRIERVRAVPERLSPGDALVISTVVRVLRDDEPLLARVDLRPVRGEEPWMRKLDELPEHKDLNLVATTPPQPIHSDGRGRYQVDVRVDSVPITPTELEVTMVLLDGSGRIHDELATTVAIGTSPARASYMMMLSTPERT